MLLLKQFQSVYQSEWFAEPFPPKICSLIQNDIGANFGDDLNFVTREHSFNRVLQNV